MDSPREKGRIKGRGILDGCPAEVFRQKEDRIHVRLLEDRGPWKKGDVVPISPEDWVKHDPADVWQALKAYEASEVKKEEGACDSCMGRRLDPFGNPCLRCCGSGIEPPKRGDTPLEALGKSFLEWLKKDD